MVAVSIHPARAPTTRAAARQDASCPGENDENLRSVWGLATACLLSVPLWAGIGLVAHAALG